jgi:hypothetical protein
MMKQQSLTGFERYGKTTRRAQFLADMQLIAPWTELTAVVEPFYLVLRTPPKISHPRLRVFRVSPVLNLPRPRIAERLVDGRLPGGARVGPVALEQTHRVVSFKAVDTS